MSTAYAADDIFLYATECVVAEVLSKNLCVVHLALCVRSDALNLKLYLSSLMRILLYGVADVKGLLAFNVSGLLALTKCYAIHYATRIVVYQLKFDMFLIMSYDLAGAIIVHLSGTEDGLQVIWTKGLEAFEVVV